MRKKTLLTAGIIVSASVLTAATAMAAGDFFRISPAVSTEEDGITITAPEGGKGARFKAPDRHIGFGFGFEVDVKVTDEQKAEALAQIKAQLDEKVASGALTQEQADKIYSSMQEGEFTVSCRPNENIKDILGDIIGELPEFPALTEDHRAEMTERMKEQIAAMVEKGVITQEQADEFLAKMESGESFNIELPGLTIQRDNAGGSQTFKFEGGFSGFNFETGMFDSIPAGVTVTRNSL